MGKLIVEGGRPLVGTLKVAGSKNASIAIIPAAIAVPGIHHLENVPDVLDVHVISEILTQLGAEVSFDPSHHRLILDTRSIQSNTAPYELVKKMRASFLVLGPLLARFGKAQVALPGGCRIGNRPVDLHLKGIRALGAEMTIEHGEVIARAERLVGAEITLEKISVGATENLMIAAALAHGTTVINNAACEPEVVDLANFLNACGAQIRGAGTRRIEIVGQRELTPPSSYRIIPDRIEAGTWIIAATATRGEVTLTDLNPHHLTALLEKLSEIGAFLEVGEDWVKVMPGNGLLPTSLRSQEYPGFPTDLQPQTMALLTQAKGLSVITETIFENRFTHVPELERMGAHIEVRGQSAIVEGNGPLTGAPVEAYDIRGGAAMVVAALMAEGETVIEGSELIYRGYENLVERLRSLGARVEAVDGQQPPAR